MEGRRLANTLSRRGAIVVRVRVQIIDFRHGQQALGILKYFDKSKYNDTLNFLNSSRSNHIRDKSNWIINTVNKHVEQSWAQCFLVSRHEFLSGIAIRLSST